MTFTTETEQLQEIANLRQRRRKAAQRLLKASKSLLLAREQAKNNPLAQNLAHKAWQLQEMVAENQYLIQELTAQLGFALEAIPSRVTKTYDSDGTSGWFVKIYPRDASETAISQDFNLEGSARYLGVEGRPGKMFTYDAEIIRKGSRCLVKKFWALDV
ncbi:MAG: hypothetical protein HC875_20675 [Anaerolineales bacterium]|nr:hypothetical protein [Anaerolineales bacterium]